MPNTTNMVTELGKLVTAICDGSSVWPSFLETNCIVIKVFVEIGPSAYVLTILSDLYEKNVNEELLHFVGAIL